MTPFVDPLAETVDELGSPAAGMTALLRLHAAEGGSTRLEPLPPVQRPHFVRVVLYQRSKRGRVHLVTDGLHLVAEEEVLIRPS